MEDKDKDILSLKNVTLGRNDIISDIIPRLGLSHRQYWKKPRNIDIIDEDLQF